MLSGFVLHAVLVSALLIGAPPPGEGARQPVPARPAQPSTTAPVKPSAPEALEGLWPSPKLTNLMLMRWADEVSSQYDLDERQRTKVREAAVKRWGTFLTENRSAIQPLANEFIEMRWELEPPEKERVQAWAKRAMPIFKQFRKELDQGTDEFREILTPGQRVKLEAELLGVGVGLQFAESKLTQWQNGEFEVDDFWERTAQARRERREERRQRREATKKAETGEKPDEADQIAQELTAWEKYVEDFIRLYKLDEGQRGTVLSIFSELKERAIAHRDRRRDDITKLEQRIASFTGSDEELSELKKQLTELYGPIDDMFQELKHRIEQVPTVEQRTAAPKPEKSPKEGEKEPSSPDVKNGE